MATKSLCRSLAVAAAALLLAPSAWAQTLRVQYKIPGAAVTDNHVRPHLRIVNGTGAAVPYSELTIRYWYTVDGVRPQVYWCDWTPGGCNNVTSQFVAVSPARTNADFYVQVGFTAGMGSLAAGQTGGEIQGRFNKDNWTNYDEANDYSYDGTKLAFADWDRVTLYRNGVLVWGTEPPAVGGTTQTLTVNKAGTGTGTVTSSPAGISCGTTCTTANASFTTGTNVTLTASAATGSSFAGWSGACTGTGPCSVAMTQARTVTATFNTAPNNQTLTVNKAGTGTGTVTSSPAGINCGTTCTTQNASFPNGTNVTLTASAATGSSFAGWGGACTGTGPCTVAMTQARTVTATFNTAPNNQTLTVNKAGTGTGTVTSSPAGISCGTTCTTQNASFPNGTNVTLTASAATGSTFAGWSGACTGTTACTVAMTQARTVTATFNAVPTNQTLTVNKAGTGTGTVTSSPAGISCGTTCTTANASFPNGTNVTLTATAATGSTFAGWSGACTGTTACTVAMTQARTVTATFNTTTSGNAVFRVNAQGRITKNNQLFPVRCGSWFGLEGRHEPSSDPTNPSGAPMEQYIGNTFWANGGQGTGRTIQQTMSEIAQQGINVIRLPLVPQTLDPNNAQGRAPFLKNHPSVRVANSRLALEQFIVAADQAGIEIMLDVHSCSNYVGWRKGRFDARPPYADFDRDNYDFKRENFSCAATNNPPTVTTTHPYDQTRWLADLRTLAGLGQQLGVDNIIGIDIFNEPHDYTWQEWRGFTQAAYQAINEVNPNILLFVQGISGEAGHQDGTPNTFTTSPHGEVFTNPNWGENLFEAGANPPAIPRDRLVWSPHVYGPSVFVQRMFMDPAQPACANLEGDPAGDADCNIVINPTLLRQGWEEHFGYLRDQGYPVVVGEFGGNLDWPLGQASIRDRNRWSHITPGVDAQWQEAFVEYLVEKGIEGCYWSINPESGDTAGWYGHAFDPISNTAGWGEWRPFDDRKTTLLRRLWGTN